jgi:hypothetical protein
MSIRDTVASPHIIRATIVAAIVIVAIVIVFFLSRILAADYSGIV